MWRLVSIVTFVSATLLWASCLGDQIVFDQIHQTGGDIQSLLDSVMVDDTTPPGGQKLNLPDANATVGKIFTYPLRLKSQPFRYKIRELGKSNLPDWLTYNQDSGSLEGVPRPSDTGVSNIAIIPETPSSSSVKHFFTITIKQSDPTSPLTYQKQGDTTPSNHDFSCRHDDPITEVTVVVDSEPVSMDGVANAQLIVNMADYLKLDKDKLKLLPLDDKSAYDSTALVAGPGNRNIRQFSGLILTWKIGCGSVDSDSVLLLEKLELTALNGKLAAALGQPVIGWHVTNNRPQIMVARKRRQAPAITPTYETAPPSRVDNENNMDGDLARVLPTMSSPSFSKHHRRTKSSGRHSGKETRYRHASPIATPTLIPAAPTPVQTSETPGTSTDFFPLRPTQVEPSDTSPEIPIARTDILVQPSNTITEEASVPSSSSYTKTPTLPTDRYTFVEETATSKPSIKSSATEVEVIPTEREKEKFNENPYIHKEMDPIRAKFGEVLYHKIPPKTFMDREDGNTRHLKLMVLFEKNSLTPAHWLQFDYQNQVLMGILLDDRNRGRKNFTYTLAAIDSGSKVASTEFQVIMKTPSYQEKGRINHEISLEIDANYDLFVSDSSNIINVIENLGRVFGISNTYKNVNVLRVERGSVKFTFTMRNVRYQPCPADRVRDMVKHLITPNATINTKLRDQMHKWMIKSVSLEPMGSCIDPDAEKNFGSKDPNNKYLSPMRTTDIGDTKRNPPYSEVDGGKPPIDDDGPLIQYIVPAIVIGLALIIAIIVACCLHCKRKKKKKQKSMENNHYGNKGIPIIFQDEMDDKPAPASKPLIMPEEKPPQPPGYLGTRDSPNLDRHRLMYSDFDRDSSPPYRPPPPFAGNGTQGGGRGPTRGSNNHRNPQPYVPP